jgi:hypothetical protein
MPISECSTERDKREGRKTDLWHLAIREDIILDRIT